MNIGVVGFGKRIREILYTSLKEVYPDFHVTGIVDPDEKGARERLLSDEDKEKVVFYDTLDEMVRKAKIDILCIGTRCDLHTPYAIQAAKYDIPLLLEKPVAINMEQALELEKAFENTKCRVVVSFPLRLSTLGNFTKNMVDNGVVGDPISVWRGTMSRMAPFTGNRDTAIMILHRGYSSRKPPMTLTILCMS